MPYKFRTLQTTSLLSPQTMRRIAFVVGAFAVWAWLYFCTNGGNL